ncbi:MAG: 3-hydroxyacyl-CoA dehydrogenase NAD-binding domain-containing protein [Candidatus Kapabacteria bacterium]|nr:3-hydroxyacyl-CoA dehydrogenase NAD-binding domain-containing protein [Candidatus Kapabacteria bacterium]
MELNKKTNIGVLGAGTMGSGIAQVAATFGHHVTICDTSDHALEICRNNLRKTMDKLIEKGKVTQSKADDVLFNIIYSTDLHSLKNCGLIIEAIVENLDVKKTVFSKIEDVIPNDSVLASNTSSISIASIAGGLKFPERFIGLHFFNPAPIMPLVEITPSFITEIGLTQKVKQLVSDWGKIAVLAKDTPGFIVNRIARPFYSESLRILEENIADIATIDWALKEYGHFRMGPFELMDFIGHDVNYIVTETVFTQFYFDTRFSPAITQKRLLEAGLYGKKTKRGFYDYRDGATQPQPIKDETLGRYIIERVLAMLINLAYDSLYLQIASKEDIEIAMTKGVNYPKGLFAWAEEIGLENVFNTLEKLHNDYGEDRYRPCLALKNALKS